MFFFFFFFNSEENIKLSIFLSEDEYSTGSSYTYGTLAAIRIKPDPVEVGLVARTFDFIVNH